MDSFIQSVLSFVLVIGILVTIHEFGHFWVAKKLGVKVLRFSVGFGQVLYSRNFGDDKTEFALSAIPLGGYVKMLDETEGEVAPEEQHRAFNQQSVFTRIAIVAAGPLINLIFAVFAFALMYSVGVKGLSPVVEAPAPDSIAYEADFQDGDKIVSINDRSVLTWEDVSIELLDVSLTGEPVEFGVESSSSGLLVTRLINTPLNQLADGEVPLLAQLGLLPKRMLLPPVLGEVSADSPADRAGLVSGDTITRLDDTDVGSWSEVVEYIRHRPGQDVTVTVTRNSSEQFAVQLVTDSIPGEQGAHYGRIGVKVHVPADWQNPYAVERRYSPVDSLIRGAERTVEMVMLTLKMLVSMIVGDVSVKNISGPISIAHFAAESLSFGFSQFLSFLGLISVSLGVLNLLPIPVLDGGHLLYYFAEIIKGSPVSLRARMVGQQIGVALLVTLTVFAIFNDVTRLFG